MPDFNQIPFPNKPKDPLGIQITAKQLIFILVGLIFFFIVVFLVGVYIGKKQVNIDIAKEDKTEISEPIASSPDTSANQTTVSNNNDTSSLASTVTTPSTDMASPAPQPDTPLQQSSTTPPVDNSPSNLPTTTDTTLPPTQTTMTSSTQNDTSPDSKPPVLDLSPITPPIDNGITNQTKDNSNTQPSTATTDATNKTKKEKTYSLQLSALSGKDAEKRAKEIVEKVSKKYNNQYQFKIQKVGSFIKIIAINFADEKKAREALNILSQEPDFKKAFIIKP